MIEQVADACLAVGNLSYLASHPGPADGRIQSSLRFKSAHIGPEKAPGGLTKAGGTFHLPPPSNHERAARSPPKESLRHTRSRAFGR